MKSICPQKNKTFFDKLINFGIIFDGKCGPKNQKANRNGSVAGEGSDVDIELITEQVQVERKLFSFSLRQNPRGRFLKITEDVGGRRDAIIIPSTGLESIRAIVENMIKVDAEAGPIESNYETDSDSSTR